MLKKYFVLFSVLSVLQTILPSQAAADMLFPSFSPYEGYSPYSPYSNVGVFPLGMSAVSPFGQSGGFGAPGYSTGQWEDAQRAAAEAQAVYISNQFNWPGATPFGFGGAYMPPIGMDAIMNRMRYNSFSNAYGAQ